MISSVMKTVDTFFRTTGSNEDDTLKSSSILIISHSAQSIYTQSAQHYAVLIKDIKLKRE